MPDALHLDHQLCFALYAATRALTSAYQPLLAPLGLTYPQYLVMLVLWETDGVAIRDLGHRLHLDSGTLTPLVKRLERAGLVARRRDVDDERVVHVDLSPAGRALRRRAQGIPGQLLCQLELSLPELARLRGQLARLTTTLRAADADPQET
ncbi:MAG: MarR family transcriptional regulator [Kofleriaceae bacterium]